MIVWDMLVICLYIHVWGFMDVWIYGFWDFMALCVDGFMDLWIFVVELWISLDLCWFSFVYMEK